MAILILQHEPVETPGRIGDALNDVGHRQRIIELHASQPLPPDLDDVDGLVVMGGPQNVDEAGQHPWMNGELDLIRAAHEGGVPILGVCLGAQLIAAALGGKVEPMEKPEIGFKPVELQFPGKTDPLLAGIPWRTIQCHTHGQQVTQLPPDATPLASSKMCRHQAFKVGLTTYAFQYHFEWSRPQLDKVIDRFSDWMEQHGEDPAAMRAAADEHDHWYRHHGDRLTANLANLLFPIDKRLDHKTGPVQNYHASYF